MKKHLEFISVLLLLCTYAFGQAPLTFKYQTKAKDASGNNIVNRSVSFRMSIVQGNVSGPVVYKETDTEFVFDIFKRRQFCKCQIGVIVFGFTIFNDDEIV